MPAKDSIGGYILPASLARELEMFLYAEIDLDLGARREWETLREESRSLIFPEQSESLLGDWASNIKIPVVSDILKYRPRFKAAMLGDGVDIIHLRPVAPGDTKKVPLMAEYINWELVNEIRIARLLNQWLFETLIDGDGYVKDRQVIKRARRKITDASGKESVEVKVVYNGPKPRIVDSINMVIPRNAKAGQCLGELDRVTEILHWTVFDLRREKSSLINMKRGYVNAAAFDELEKQFNTAGGQELNNRVVSETDDEEIDYSISGVQDKTTRRVYEIRLEIDVSPSLKEGPQQYVVLLSHDTQKILAALETFEPRPYSRMSLYPSAKWYSLGLPMVLKPWVHLLGAMLNSAANFATISNIPFGTTEDGTFGKRRKLQIKPGEIIEGMKVDWARIEGIDNSFFSIMQFAEKFKNQLGGSELFEGISRNVAGANAPFSTTRMLLEEATKTLGDLGENLIDGFVNFVESRIAMNRLYLPPEKPFRVLGDMDVFKKITPADFPEADPDVIIGRTMSNAFKALTIETGDKIYQGLLGNPLFQNPEGLHRITDWWLRQNDIIERPMLLPPLPYEQSVDPVTENEQLIQGTPVAVSPQDNDEFHLAKHQEPLANEQIAGMITETTRVRIVQHIQAHVAQLQKKMSQQQQQPGGAGGPGPGIEPRGAEAGPPGAAGVPQEQGLPVIA